MMTGKDLKILDPLENADFVHSVGDCIASEIGREYLFRYLHQKHCEEMVLFLKLMIKYKSIPSMDSKERLLMAADISTLCLNPHSPFSIKVPFECKQKVFFSVYIWLTVCMSIYFVFSLEWRFRKCWHRNCHWTR